MPDVKSAQVPRVRLQQICSPALTAAGTTERKLLLLLRACLSFVYHCCRLPGWSKRHSSLPPHTLGQPVQGIISPWQSVVQPKLGMVRLPHARGSRCNMQCCTM